MFFTHKVFTHWEPAPTVSDQNRRVVTDEAHKISTLFLGSRSAVMSGKLFDNRVDRTLSCLPADEKQEKGGTGGKGKKGGGKGKDTVSDQKSKLDSFIDGFRAVDPLPRFDFNAIFGYVDRKWQVDGDERLKILELVKLAVLDIEETLTRGQNAPVICHQGCLRSATIVGFYIMAKTRCNQLGSRDAPGSPVG